MTDRLADIHSQSLSEQRTLSGNEVAGIFYNSYKFSQGDERIQALMFAWIGLNDKIIPNDIPPDLGNILSRAKIPQRHYQSFAGSPVSHNDNTDGILDKFVQAIRNPSRFIDVEGIDKNQLEKEILERMIDSDRAYQREKHLRPGRSKTDYESDSDDDPHASFVRRYIVNNQYPGHQIYAQMMRSLASSLATAHPDVQDLFSELKLAWEVNHPEEKFDPPAEAAA